MVFRASTAHQIKFSINDFSKCDQIQKKTADLVTFTEEILNGNFTFCSLVSVISVPAERGIAKSIHKNTKILKFKIK